MRLAVTVLVCGQLLCVVLGTDLFSSVHDMEDLAYHENELLQFMHEYITHQENKLVTLIEKYKQLLQVKPLDQSPEEYASHPVNAFSLIKRMTREWPLILHLMVEQTSIPPDLVVLPGEVDLRSAYRGLARLQEVYKINTKELVEGNLDEIPSKYKMSADGRTKHFRTHVYKKCIVSSLLRVERIHDVWRPILETPWIQAMDCYEMGKYWYKQTVFPMAQSWFDQALLMISEGDLTVQEELVSSHLYLAVAFSGCVPMYVNNMAATNNLLYRTFVNNPMLTVSSDLSFDFSQALAKNCSWVIEQDIKKQEDYYMNDNLNHQYSEMCMGLGDTPASGLKCHYIHYNNPRLLVAPFKAEELNLDPHIIMFHDVVSDKEIENMKISFYKVMSECQTVAGNNQSSLSYYRTCHVGWVDDWASETSALLSRRMADMSNLNLKSSEVNQVANYGLGGEFQLHTDALEQVSLSPEFPLGNRIATIMLYLNNVANGGRTVFPMLKVSVKPRKGSAVLWFNIDRQSQRANAMLHGGCPVLRGTKWVLNKWVREAGQDFQTSCPSSGEFIGKYLNQQ